LSPASSSHENKSFYCKTQTTLGEKLAKKQKRKYEWLTKKDTMNIQTRLDPEILEAAKKAAETEGVTLSEYLRKLLREDVESRNPEERGGDDEGNLDS
jgi:predicted DNA binding CopG/RHH family protein